MGTYVIEWTNTRIWKEKYLDLLTTWMSTSSNTMKTKQNVAVMKNVYIVKEDDSIFTKEGKWIY